MKYRAIVAALLMAFIIALPCVPVGSDSDAGTHDGYHPAYDSLNPSQKSLYDRLEDAVGSFRTTVKVSGLTLEETWKVYYAFTSDFPEFYWFGESYSIYYYTDTGLPSEIKADGHLDSKKLKKGMDEIDETFKRIDIAGDTDAKRLQCVQQYLAFNIVYDKTTENCGDLYGALVNGRAKCDGYSAAFQFCSKMLDIPCVTFTGDVVSEGRHAWNAVRMEDGKWYHVDATWDDPRCPDMVEYDYFLIGSDTDTPTGTFGKNRTVDYDFGIEVSSKAYAFDPYQDGYWMDYIPVPYKTLSKAELKNSYYYWTIHDVQIQVDEDARKALVSAMLRYDSDYWYVTVKTYRSSTPVESVDLKDYEIGMYLDDAKIVSLSSEGLSGLIKFVPPDSVSEPSYVPEYYSLDGVSFDKGSGLKLKDLDRFTVGYVPIDFLPLLLFILVVVSIITLFIWYRRRSSRRAMAAYYGYSPQYPPSETRRQSAGRYVGFCPQCGASLHDGESFCVYCGRNIDGPLSSENDDRTDGKT